MTIAARAIGVLVIGAGPAAVMKHLPALAALRDHGDVALLLICDTDDERARAAQRQFGFSERSADALTALARADVDAVYIFGSAQMHYEYGLAALRSGKHLFVEKPIAASYAKAREMADAAAAHGLVAVGGHNRRFYESFAAVRAHAGKTRWRLAEAVFHKPEYGRTAPYGARSWLSANGIHALDALLFMMGGLPEYLSALAGETAAVSPSTFSAVMRWQDGAQGMFLCNNNGGLRREDYVFHGLGETLSVTATGVTLEKNGRRHTTAHAHVGDGFVAEHACFVRAVRSGDEPVHSIAAIAPSLFLAELVEAGFNGRIRLPSASIASTTALASTAMIASGATIASHQSRSAPSTRRGSGKSILIANPMELQSALARLLPDFRLVSLEDVARSTDMRRDIVAALLGRGSSALPADVWVKLPRLEILGFMGLSLARHAPCSLLARGIKLVNAGEAYAQSAAEFAFALAILARRRAFNSHALMCAGGWGIQPSAPALKVRLRRTAGNLRPVVKWVGLEPVLRRAWMTVEPLIGGALPKSPPAAQMKGATVGLIGWGSMASAFTQRLNGAQARVLVYSENAMPEHVKSAGATPVSLSEALAADIVSLHRGLTANTRHFLRKAELEKLRPGAVLINVARGALIEPAALLDRLRRGDLFACLDTYEEEPLPASHPLRRLPNVFLTSHIAGGSPDMHAAAAEEVVRKVADYLRGVEIESISAQRLSMMT